MPFTHQPFLQSVMLELRFKPGPSFTRTEISIPLIPLLLQDDEFSPYFHFELVKILSFFSIVRWKYFQHLGGVSFFCFMNSAFKRSFFNLLHFKVESQMLQLSEKMNWTSSECSWGPHEWRYSSRGWVTSEQCGGLALDTSANRRVIPCNRRESRVWGGERRVGL